MVRRFLITVRIRRANGPPRVRIFVVHIARAAGEWAAPSVRAAVALVLMASEEPAQSAAMHPRPGDDDGQRPRGRAAAAPRRGPQLRGPRHPHPTGARRRPGGLPGHAGGPAPSWSAAGCARCLGPPARGPGGGAGPPRHRPVPARGCRGHGRR